MLARVKCQVLNSITNSGDVCNVYDLLILVGTPAQTAKVISATSHTPSAMGMSGHTAPSPMKISFTKSPGKAHTTITPSQQKVCIILDIPFVAV